MRKGHTACEHATIRATIEGAARCDILEIFHSLQPGLSISRHENPKVLFIFRHAELLHGDDFFNFIPIIDTVVQFTYMYRPGLSALSRVEEAALFMYIPYSSSPYMPLLRCQKTFFASTRFGSQ